MTTTTLRVEFVSESAAYRNTFGWYNKVTGVGGVLFSDVESEGRHAPLDPGDFVTFTVDTADVGNIEYFLIDNGGGISANSDAELSGPVKVIQLANGDWAVATLDANGNVQMKNGKPNILQGEDSNGFFTEKSKNEGNVDHASSKVGTNQTTTTLNGDTADGPTGLLAWEDLAATKKSNGQWSKPGDADYNDAVFKISLVNQPPANQAPNANNDTASVSEDAGATTINVLGNDTDPDAGDTLHVSAVNTAGVLGTVTIAPGGTGILYTPAASFQSLAVGQTATETFTYTVMDDDGATDTATTTVTVVGANDGPTVSDDVEGGGAEGSGTATVNLLQFASDIDNGAVLHIENLDWDEVSTPGAMPAGFTLVGNSIQVDTNSPAYNAMAVGETFATHFTYDVVDQHGARVTQHATVNITGTNDAPIITGGQTTGAVTEDIPLALQTSGQLTATDVDNGATRTWSIMGGSTAVQTQDFRYQIDNLKVVKNNFVFFEDTFGDGIAPPSGPNFPPTTGLNPSAYSTGNGSTNAVFTEAAGRAMFDGTQAITFGATNYGLRAMLNSDTNPASDPRGLKNDDDFTVEARFDLITPEDDGDAYGVRLIDQPAPPGTNNSLVDLVVLRDASGVRVALRQIDISAGTGPVILQSFALAAGANDQIVLRLDYDKDSPANMIGGGQVTAEFDLLTNGVVSSTTSFASLGTIFQGEQFTRVQVIGQATQAETGVHKLAGTYGTLTVAQDGQWHYFLADQQANVQALAQGETVTDTFTVQATDQHGASDTETVTITVTGTNDAPVVTGDNTAHLTEDQFPLLQRGELSVADPDNGATHTWSIVGGTTANQDFNFSMDEFRIVRNTQLFFDDHFDNNMPPPNAPNIVGGGSTSYNVGGSFFEGNGRLLLVGTNSTLSVVNINGLPSAGVNATLNTDITANPNAGLKSNQSFSVEGRFDLAMPIDVRDQYGIRLGDSTSPTTGDSVVSLAVRRDADGVFVNFSDLNFVSATGTPIQRIALNALAGDDQIVLRLSHDPLNTGIISAAFDLIDNGVVTSTTLFSSTGTIFEGENWTRAQIIANGAPETISVRQGTYSTLTVDQDGDWIARTRNGQAAVQALAEGETATETFQVQVTDQHGASDTETVTVTVAGENDAPIITGGTTTGSVQEDGNEFASGTLNATDVDNGATRTWSVAGENGPHVADYRFELDNFKVTKNGNPLFEDTFGDGNPPPSAPNFIPNNTPTSYAIDANNVFSEANGRVIMDASVGTTPVAIGQGVGHFATLNSNIDPNDTNLGLKSNHDFVVEGRFDLILPDIGERYGVRFTDNAGPGHPGDDAISLSVTRELDGSLRVTLGELDFVADTTTPISFVLLNPAAGDDQIVLRLTHQASNPGVLTASFDLMDNGVVTSASVMLPGFGQIFGTETPGNPGDNENWTRAQFVSTDTTPVAHYGTLTINQTGGWNYDLANEMAHVQALAEGETVIDTFTVQVTDEHGASDTETINITVTGENDAPIIVAGQFTGNVQENGPQSVASGTLTASDIDHGATRTWSIVNGPVPDVADYHFLIDNFSVIRNSTFWYNDDFGDGIEPPSGGFFFPNTPDQNAATYSVPPGVIIETGGRAILDGHDPAGPFSFGSGVGHFVALNSNTSNSPADLGSGLKIDDDFTVEGRFELITPDSNQNYGIRVTDSNGSVNLGDDTIQLTVNSSPSGGLFLNMSRINFVNQTTTFLGGIQIHPQPGDDQIVLRLHHQASNPGVITASYELLDNEIVTGGGGHPGTAQIFGLSTPANLADDELYTRAQFVAGESVVPTMLNGEYGSLSLNQNGNWTYFLANGQENVEALSQGETVFDTFDIQVTDEHGAFDTQTVTINVAGRNDAPLFAPPPGPVDLTEAPGTTGSSIPVTAAISLGFSDVDLSDIGHSASKLGVATSGVTAGLPDSNTLLSYLTIDGVTKNAGSSIGQVNATLSAPDSAFDYLGQGELAFLHYTVQVDDHDGGTSDVTFLVKIEGRNDLTVITDATAAGSAAELADGNAGENLATHSATGTIGFADVDLTDPHSVSVAAPPANYRGTFNAGISDSANGDGDGEITWTFSVQDSELDDLAANETLTQTYTVELVDNRGSFVTQTVTVTITGAADGPNVIMGTPNDDILVSTAADDSIFGLAGRDWGVFTAATDGISVDMAAGTASGAGIGSDTFDSIELIRGGNFADTYVATGYAGNANLPSPLLNAFEGMGGNDVITGNGSTQISYQSATDFVTVDFNLANAVGDASVGTDTYSGVNGVRGSAFNDFLRGSDNLTGVETFTGGAGNDLIVGRGGFDRAIVEPNVDNTVTGGVAVNMAAGTIVGDPSVGTDTLRAVEAVRGTSFADIYVATNFGAPGFVNPAVNNVGSQGNFNEFEGLGGNDTITGNGNTRIVYSLATGSVTVDLILGTAIGDPSVGTDTFTGVNSVVGSTFDDQIFGSTNLPGTGEVFEGRGGNDMIDGRGGFDQAAYNNDPLVTMGVAINLATGIVNNGTVTGDAAVGTDTLIGIESVRGTNLGDTFVATGTGFNEFEGAGGNDSATGNGNTRLSFQSASSGVTVNLVDGTAIGGSTGSDTFTGVNAVRGSNSVDTIIGNSANNFLDGLGGNDSLQGGDGNDTLTGGAGGDSLVGGNGFDTADYSTSLPGLTINVGAGGDTGDAVGDSFVSIEQIVGSNGNDVIISDGNQHFMRGGLGADTFHGGGGFDWVMYTTSAAGLTVDLTNTGNNTGEAAGDSYLNFAFISVGGSNHNDTLVGNAGGNHLMGGAGADVLNGMGDLDFADYGNANFGVTANLANSAVNTGDAFGDTYISLEHLWGSAHNDVLTGDGADNELQGQAGGDILDGAGGIDIATYQQSSAAVDVSLATGLGFGGDAAGDTLFNFENLRGSEWNDTLTGDNNANLIDGLGGVDTMTGGGGADMFFFNFPSQGLDNILDFVSGQDKLVVVASGFGGGLVPGGPVTLVEAASKEDAFNFGSDGYFILDNDFAFNGTVYWDATGGDGDDAIGLTVLASLPPLTASDFLVV